jgi:hypothetical protein
VITMKRFDLKAFKSDFESFEKLFLLFLERLPLIYQNNDKTIPFVIAELTLCNHRIKREDAKRLLKEFVKKGFLISVKFRGYKLNSKKLTKLLNYQNVFSFVQNFGLNFANSPFFQQLIYHKAKSDFKFWLKHAPHKLGENDE